MQFVIYLNCNNNDEFVFYGQQDIEFLVSVNLGQLVCLLVKVVFGGEFFWISLVIQVVVVQILIILILVFDEVDVGIGGGIVEVVGCLLCSFGSNGQVLCVIYLLQVVVQCYQYLFVSKFMEKDVIFLKIEVLDDQGWIDEVVRMLGGVDMIEYIIVYVWEMFLKGQVIYY